MIEFETHPSRYRHWRLSLEPPVAWLTMSVAEDAPIAPGYRLKLNSYDLGVDIELADAVGRLRFEHPEIRAVVITGGLDRTFCAGANIHMLATSSHGFKVNFCKFTNETRLAIEDATAHSGQRYIAACNGTAAGGGYELAMACERIYLVDDGSSAVSLPEIPLLGVLPGTGGLTRLVDKRKVRRDLADVFSTLPEGVKGRRAVEWKLVDDLIPRSRFVEAVRERVLALPAEDGPQREPLALEPLAPEVTGDAVRYRHVELALDRGARIAELTVRSGAGPEWALRAFREIDDALLRLRFHYDNVALVLVKTRGSIAEALAADRSYMLDDSGVEIAIGVLNGGGLPGYNGASRLALRYVEAREGVFDAAAALEAGLVTAVFDEIDWEEELRVAAEERASLSPDALTAMEANLRFPGAESMETRVFGRLSAWQNWIFSRPNATGERGALSLYGKPERPQFDWRRT
ncbi:MAG: enoyl-CoA hydratase-related protein [Bryobacteraceae bacterium]